MAVIGDMFELGDFSAIEHEKIIELCKEYQIETYFIGTHFYPYDDGTHFYKSIQDFLPVYQELQLEDCMILVKGSRGVHLEGLFQ